MALHFNHLLNTNSNLDNLSFVSACSLFYYSKTLHFDRITKALKYSDNVDIGKVFASIAGGYLLKCEFLQDVDCIIPIPLHWIRRHQRGYNQSSIIARQISTILGVDYSDKIIKRKSYTKTQTSLGMKDRFNNVKDVFKITGKGLDIAKTKKYRHMLLVDDTYTSGATFLSIFSCVYKKLIQNEGLNIKISIFSLAFVDK